MYLILFQILVLLGTISDWPWLASWQRFYSRSLPTEKLQATVPTSLKASHTFTIFFCFVNLQKNRCMRKELKSSDLCLRPKSAAITFNLACFLLSDDRSILSTIADLKFIPLVCDFHTVAPADFRKFVRKKK